MWEVTPRAGKLGALRHSNMQRVGGRVFTDRQIKKMRHHLRMTKQNPEQIEANIAKFVYDEALHQASCSSAPQDVAAATAAILQAAFIMATADLSPERRAGMVYGEQMNQSTGNAFTAVSPIKLRNVTIRRTMRVNRKTERQDMKISDFKPIATIGTGPLDWEYFAKVTVTTRPWLFWKKSECRKVYRKYADLWRFADTGKFCPDEVHELMAAFNATQNLNQSMKGKP